MVFARSTARPRHSVAGTSKAPRAHARIRVSADPCRISDGVECLAGFEPCDRSLQRFKPLVVVALGRDDRRVTEEIADLSKRNVPLDQP